jgi:hypothetical protein
MRRSMPLKTQAGVVQRDSIVSVIADGAIANPDVNEGRMVPLVILDTATRPDIDELIRLHGFFGPGDVKSQWASSTNNENIVFLKLSFLRPVELTIYVEFDLSKGHNVLIEQALISRALYIQAGRPGDRLKDDVDKPKLILEVPDGGFRERWEKIHLCHATAKMRERGAARADAKRMAKTAIELIRTTITWRAPS